MHARTCNDDGFELCAAHADDNSTGDGVSRTETESPCMHAQQGSLHASASVVVASIEPGGRRRLSLRR